MGLERGWMVHFSLKCPHKERSARMCVSVCVRRRVPVGWGASIILPGLEKFKYEIFFKALNGKVSRAAGRPACIYLCGDGGH